MSDNPQEEEGEKEKSQRVDEATNDRKDGNKNNYGKKKIHRKKKFKKQIQGESQKMKEENNSNKGTDENENEKKKQKQIGEDFRGRTDEEFQVWTLQQLKECAPQLVEHYGSIMERASVCVMKWRQRYRGDSALWNRIFKKDKVFKEIVEAIPILPAVLSWIDSYYYSATGDEKRITVMDLCSGKGYLSMLLSEYCAILHEEKQLGTKMKMKFILIDKAWPMCKSVPQPHHMSWEHVYGDQQDTTGTAPQYYETWPIPIVTSKEDLKSSSVLKKMKKRYENEDKHGKVLILAIHLCGTLSLQAIKLYHSLPNAQVLVLKPCCLPGIWHIKNKTCFEIGTYKFDPKDVCARGSWTSDHQKGRWKGPPRWHLKDRFHKWCFHLHQGLKMTETTQAGDEKDNKETTTVNGDGKSCQRPDTPLVLQTRLLEVPVQTKGCYQNSFLFAEKQPWTNGMWDKIAAQELETYPVMDELMIGNDDDDDQDGNAKKKFKYENVWSSRLNPVPAEEKADPTVREATAQHEPV